MMNLKMLQSWFFFLSLVSTNGLFTGSGSGRIPVCSTPYPFIRVDGKTVEQPANAKFPLPGIYDVGCVYNATIQLDLSPQLYIYPYFGPDLYNGYPASVHPVRDNRREYIYHDQVAIWAIQRTTNNVVILGYNNQQNTHGSRTTFVNQVAIYVTKRASPAPSSAPSPISPSRAPRQTMAPTVNMNAKCAALNPKVNTYYDKNRRTCYICVRGGTYVRNGMCSNNMAANTVAM